MTRRISVCWPDGRPFAGRNGASIRLLAVSDEPDRTLDDARNREALGAIDLVVGCGDAAADYLAYVAEAFAAPLVYVRGNHDSGEAWNARSAHLPTALPAGRIVREAGVQVTGLSWPGQTVTLARRDEQLAGRHVVSILLRRIVRRLLFRSEPLLVVSHAPPLGAGDVATDPYHLGFRAYRWLLNRARPPLWLHGHTPLAAGPWLVEAGPTTVVNVTGSVLVELLPPGAEADEAG